MKWKDYIIRRRIDNIEMWMRSRGLASVSALCDALQKIGVFPPPEEDLNILFPKKQTETATNETNNAPAGIDQAPTRSMAGDRDGASLHSDGNSNLKLRSKRT